MQSLVHISAYYIYKNNKINAIMDALQPNFINPYETTICEIFVYILNGTIRF